MSSGTLPLDTYHRAQAIGSGSYGSVVTVYNDDGEEFALKLFDDTDEEDDDIGLSLGCLREISILRLLRKENSHPNVISIHDVQTGYSDDADEAGAGTDGCLSVAMPLFPLGSVMDAVKSKKIRSKEQKVRVAHGLLSAVAYLHENSIIHRDIKCDNVLIKFDSDGNLHPVLIDFSLAKVVDPSVTIPGGCHMAPNDKAEYDKTHTPSIGTPTYRAPEVIEEEPYSFPSDIWSVGVCLLELLRGKELETNKDKGTISLIQDCLAELPTEQPFPNLIRSLLEKDPTKRPTAMQALEDDVFRKFGLVVNPQTSRKLNLKTALPFENDGESSEQGEENLPPAKANAARGSSAASKMKKVDPVLSKRYKRIRNICQAMEWENRLTAQAALTYSTQMSELCDMDDPDDPQALLDCIILAHKFFEPELTDISGLSDIHGCFEKWDVDEYVDNEGTIFMMLDFCLYPRECTAV